MNVAQIVDQVSKQTSLSKRDTRNAINALLITIVDAVKAGDTVRLTSFGTFKKVHYNARKGINPQTGKTISIKAKSAPKFVAGKNFKVTVDKAGKK